MVAGGTVLDVLARAVWADTGFRTPTGVDAVPLVPLTVSDQPVFALTYAERALAETIAASRQVAVCATEPRAAFGGWRPVVVTGRVRLEEDRDGTLFREDLLDEELRKHPPSRLIADSLAQRRDHWWFLPRLLLWFEGDRVQEVAPRRSGDNGSLFWDALSGVDATTVAVDDWSLDEVPLRPLGPDGAPATARACLVRHDFSADFERRCVLRLQGRVDRGRLLVDARHGSAELPPVPGLLARWRDLRALERACRRELSRARAGRQSPGGQAMDSGP